MRDTCSQCHSHTLELLSCDLITRGVFLTPDGFALSDATAQDTDNEIFQCSTCQAYQVIVYADYPSFEGDETCSDPPGHTCRDNDVVCGCQCDGCIDETEPRCIECNAVLLESGRCPL